MTQYPPAYFHDKKSFFPLLDFILPSSFQAALRWPPPLFMFLCLSQGANYTLKVPYVCGCVHMCVCVVQSEKFAHSFMLTSSLMVVGEKVTVTSMKISLRECLTRY